MSQVESTLRMVNGRLVGNRNWRLTYHEGWDFRHVTLRRRLMEQEARETAMTINLDGIAAVLPELPLVENDDLCVDFCSEDYDVDSESRQRSNPEAELETFFQQVESGEIFDETDYDCDFTNATPGDITFDTSRPHPVEAHDSRWDGLEDHLEAMQSFRNGEIQEHELHCDGISDTHYYHAARTGIIAVDRFDLYGDRNPRAWWPILETA